MSHKSSHVNNNYTVFSYNTTYYEYDVDSNKATKITRHGTYCHKNKSPRPTHKTGYSWRYRGNYCRNARINMINSRELLSDFPDVKLSIKLHRDARDEQAMICDWDGVSSRRANNWKQNKHAKHQYEWHM